MVCFIPVSIYIGLYYLVVIPPLAVFPVCFYFAFRSFGFSCHFLEQFLPITSLVFFSICYRFYLHFWGTSFSKQWSVDVSERDVRSLSSTHCSNVIFAYFEQVIVCWRREVLH